MDSMAVADLAKLFQFQPFCLCFLAASRGRIVSRTALSASKSYLFIHNIHLKVCLSTSYHGSVIVSITGVPQFYDIAGCIASNREFPYFEIAFEFPLYPLQRIVN